MQKISVAKARPGMKVAKPVWHPLAYKILLNAGTTLTETYLKRLTELNIKEIFIGEDSYYGEGMNLEAIPMLNNIPDSVDKQIYIETYSIFNKIYKDVREGKALNIPPVARTVEAMVDRIIKDQNMLIQMAWIKSQDDYTVTHSVNVSIFSIVLGAFLGWNRETLIELGTGALLHDVGKARIPTMILNKPGALDQHEFAVIQKHPILGFEQLAELEGVSDTIKTIVRDHHERCDGSGYPSNLKADSISEAARVVAIADVYDALTTDRVYREAMQPHEVIELLMANSAMGYLDQRFIRLFLHNVAVYPIGSIVELTNGQFGKVISIPSQMPMRPVIEVKTDEGKKKDIPLIEFPTLFIKRIIFY